VERKKSHIISYLDLVTKEKEHLQKGMNFRKDNRPSVFLMSVKENSPYQDEWDEERQLLSYEGHDAYGAGAYKKKLDQPLYSKAGTLTDNGKFFTEVERYKDGTRLNPLQVQVYEKLTPGVWYDKGVFELTDTKVVRRSNRNVIVFYLHPKKTFPDTQQESVETLDYVHERMIPSSVKVTVWKRDGGKCTTCGESTGLHYDHILPFSKGGRSDDARNIQLLCARHNLQKSDKIM
jgi:HNH endonuclease